VQFQNSVFTNLHDGVYGSAAKIRVTLHKCPLEGAEFTALFTQWYRRTADHSRLTRLACPTSLRRTVAAARLMWHCVLLGSDGPRKAFDVNLITAEC